MKIAQPAVSALTCIAAPFRAIGRAFAKALRAIGNQPGSASQQRRGKTSSVVNPSNNRNVDVVRIKGVVGVASAPHRAGQAHRSGQMHRAEATAHQPYDLGQRKSARPDNGHAYRPDASIAPERSVGVPVASARGAPRTQPVRFDGIASAIGEQRSTATPQSPAVATATTRQAIAESGVAPAVTSQSIHVPRSAIEQAAAPTPAGAAAAEVKSVRKRMEELQSAFGTDGQIFRRICTEGNVAPEVIRDVINRGGDSNALKDGFDKMQRICSRMEWQLENSDVAGYKSSAKEVREILDRVNSNSFIPGVRDRIALLGNRTATVGEILEGINTDFSRVEKFA